MLNHAGGNQLEVERTAERIVYIVDDDEAIRRLIRRILTASGIYTEEFGSAEDFLAEMSGRRLGCVLLDIQLPQMSGLELLSEIRKCTTSHPTIMLSGLGDVPCAVDAIKAGAIDFIQKPFRKERLLEIVNEAFEVMKSSAALHCRGLISLTEREREVLLSFADGAPNKVVGRRLDIGARTVEMHRANILKKLGVTNLIQALFLARDAGFLPLSK